MSIEILGIPIDNLSRPEALEKITSHAISGKRLVVATVNPEFIMEAKQDAPFRKHLLEADLRLPDGVGVLWAAAFLRLPWRGPLWAWWQAAYSGASLIFRPSFSRKVIRETVSGSWLVSELARRGEAEGWRIFLLGGAPGVGKKVEERWGREYPDLHVESSSADPNDDLVVGQIIGFRPHLILVAYRARDQLAWLSSHLPALPPAIGIGVGGTLDYLTGGVSVESPGGSLFRARPVPKLLQSLGLEWLWRLITQPWRWRRILTAVPLFMVNVVQYKKSLAEKRAL